MERDTLTLDRYLTRGRCLIDLATGLRVQRRWRDGREGPVLFGVREDRVLIDVDVGTNGRVEFWERRWGDVTDGDLDAERACIEALEMARHGAPRLLTLGTRSRDRRAGLVRRVARSARGRGWVPIAVSELCRLARAGLTGLRPDSALRACDDARLPSWLAARSLLIFEDERGIEDAIRVLSCVVTSAAAPHVLIAWQRRRVRAARPIARVHDRAIGFASIVRESEAPFGFSEDLARHPTAMDEASARWPVLLASVSGAAPIGERPALQLARLLVRSGRTFEARGWLVRPSIDPAIEHERAALLDEVHDASRQAAGVALRERVSAGHPAPAGRDGMVDDFVGVLQLCQDIEDERVALSRVGAYVRERLQAASVAFVVRDGPGARTIASAGLGQAKLDAALTAIESGCTITTCTDGPYESAAPVRYAADVIGALWVRWSAGMPVSGTDASALLGVAAIAAAPSLRGVLDRERPVPDAVVPELVGASQAIRAVREAVVRAAQSPFPVIIEGESGVGKELVARAIHAGGVRRERRFSAINCAALVDDLVEAELFGHARGAFTGAQTDRPGLFEDASGGTLFLDEVAELGSRVQAKLLRTLQEGEVRRIGEAHTRRVDVRIVAATNRPLAAEVTSGRFRRDLWYRLDVIRIAIPPVRERLEDIPLLVRHAWSDLAARTGSRAMLSASAVAGLAAYDWPGNVRELQNVLASILVSAPRRGVLGPSILPAHVARAAALAPAGTLDAARRQFETRFVRAALARANGRPSIAARELGLSRQGLAKVLVRLGLSEPVGPQRTRVAQVE